MTCVKLRQSRNSVVVRIPSAVMQAARLVIGESVDVRAEVGRVVIEPLRKKSYDLRTLIAGIDANNRHEPADFGTRRGKEVW